MGFRSIGNLGWVSGIFSYFNCFRGFPIGFRELGNPIPETYKGFHIVTNPETLYRFPRKPFWFRVYPYIFIKIEKNTATQTLRSLVMLLWHTSIWITHTCTNGGSTPSFWNCIRCRKSWSILMFSPVEHLNKHVYIFSKTWIIVLIAIYTEIGQ